MKPRSGPVVSETDVQLFRDTVGPVRPLRHGHPTPPPRHRPRPALLRQPVDQPLTLEALLGPATGRSVTDHAAPLQFLRPGLQPVTLRRLQRGAWGARDELDLHHMTAATAHASLLHFIEEACHAEYRCVRIIHGKGLGSPMGGPILKQLTAQLLRGHDQVLAFCSARPEQGGTGAVLVLLRAP